MRVSLAVGAAGWHMVRAMSIERPLRELVQAELRGRLGPLHKAVARMNERLDVLAELDDIVHRLAPLATRMSSLQQLAPPGVGAPAEGGRGRRAEAEPLVPAPRGRPAGLSGATAEETGRRCAVMGCKRPARSKGYCSAHYQKLRLLVKTGRRPEKWTDDAKPQSVPEVVLPRGRAASKALAETPTPTPQRSEPPKPKAWVRKKGAKDRVSLH